MRQAKAQNSDSLMRAILSRAPVGIAVIDYNGIYRSVNPAYCAIYGYSVEDMTGMNYLNVFPVESRDGLIARHQDFLDNGGHLGEEWTFVFHDGVERTIWYDSVPFPSETGRPDRLVYVLDITEQKQSQEQRRIASTVYETTTEAIVVADSKRNIISANPAFTRLTGYSFEEVCGCNPQMFRSDRHPASFYSEIWQILEKDGLWTGEIWDSRKNGEYYLKDMTITVMKDAAGQVLNYVFVFADMTERKAADDIIRRQANYDSVTGLPNRHMFHQKLEQGAQRATQDGSKTALLLIDLDRFKDVNDTLGHSVGDRLLADVSTRLLALVRPEDTVARVGGDEFALIVTGLAVGDDVDAMACDVLRCFQEPVLIGDETLVISASIGISIYPDHACDTEELFKNADQALYAAKASGRNSLHYFTPALEQAAVERRRMISELRCAVAEEQFEVHYQPIIDLRSGRITKAEALIRWRHPTRGLVSPAAFIPLAEETGLIVPIGDWVARQAIAEVTRCRQQFDPHFQIAVNQSPVQFLCKDFAGNGWFHEMSAQGLDGSAISVEITEGVLLNAESVVMTNLRVLHAAGLHIAIDDFGTGYSSLAYLRKFDIDTLKIDRTFIADLEGPGLDICEAIIVMAHRLGLNVVAEGVETERQCEILRSIGCDFVQGFLYATALPAEAFKAMLQEQATQSAGGDQSAIGRGPNIQTGSEALGSPWPLAASVLQDI